MPSQPNGPNPSGYCECGCGGVTPRADRTRKRLGVRKGDHYRFVRGHHIRLRDDYWTDDDKAALAECVRRGMGNREIAEQLGRPTPAVKAAAIRFGIAALDPRGDRPWTSVEDAVLLSMRAERCTYQEIGDRLGRTAWGITNRVRALDLPALGPRATEERFWEKVDKRGPEECWPWLGTVDRKGYGILGNKGHPEQPRSAHRLSWVLNCGPIPDGLWVLHRCDNPPCVNPAHLFLGTSQDNVDDMWAKGRASKPPRRPSRVAAG